MNEFIQGLKQGMENFGKVIVSIVNFILLLPAYIIGVGLTSILAKIVGKKFINLEKEKKDSYWISEEVKTEKEESYYKQY